MDSGQGAGEVDSFGIFEYSNWNLSGCLWCVPFDGTTSNLFLFERNSPNSFKTSTVLGAYAAGTSFSIAKKKQNAIQELRP